MSLSIFESQAVPNLGSKLLNHKEFLKHKVQGNYENEEFIMLGHREIALFTL